VKENLADFGQNKTFRKTLNLGTGEGDYDPMIAAQTRELISCDINENDLRFAKQLNAHLENTTYQVEDALQLSFADNSFDLLVSVDVMEHVGQPERMTEEIGRILRPGGLGFITFPQLFFPWTYDPINRILSKFTKKKISHGAYAFGHEYLINGEEFKLWAAKNDLDILKEKNLSGHFTAASEVYWTGIIQSIFKDNAGNVSGQKEKKIKLRPSTKEPALVALTDAFIKLDYTLFKNSKYSVGKGFVVRKKS